MATLKVCIGWIGLAASLAANAGATGPAEEAVAPASKAFLAAEARGQDAETLKTLTAEGQILFQRDKVKLDGYQYCSQSVALAERGELRLSIEAATKALHVGKETRDGALVAAAKRDLAIAYDYAGDLDHAEDFANQAIAEPGADPRQVLAPAWKVLGDVSVRRGHHVKAVDAYNRALQTAGDRFATLVKLSLVSAHIGARDPEKARRLFGQIRVSTDPALRQMALRTEGNLLLAEGKPDAALEVFVAAGRAAAGSDADYHRLWALEGEGRAWLAKGDTAAAYRSFVAAADLSESVRARFRSEEFKTGLFGDTQQIFDRAVGLAMAAGDAEAAWQLSERSRARSLLDLVRDRVAVHGGGAGPNAVPLAEVRGVLRPGEALVEFHVLEERTVAWVVRADGMTGVSLPLTKKQLETAVTDLRNAVIKRRRTTDAVAEKLGHDLLAPLNLRSGERLVIVPHGALHYLPFQVLRGEGRYLVEDHSLGVVPSASIAVQLRHREATGSGRLVAFGNPAIDEDHDLPAAEQEVDRIVKLFPDRRAYLRQQATRQRFLDQAGQGRVVHVAAHAEVDSVDPLESRILFAQEGDGPGLLRARDIYGLDLGKVSLVTLSACESGLGRVARGDEIQGFTRSFLSAGSEALVVSLWPVADESTELLMSTFYGELAKGREAAEAMRSSELAVMHHTGFSHPFFWAPFNLIGDWRLRVADRRSD